ncbi:MAG: hypothetical protein LBH92_01450 [Bacteroidales bacterium]|jgi:hypothetical protein|nr:hypothetical protein [Bacteroidales bacterium]
MLDYISHYKKLVFIKNKFQQNNPDFLYSVFAYGSTGRFEIKSISSDIDLIAVLKPSNALTSKMLFQLNSIVNGITSTIAPTTISVHIWNYDELFTRNAENEGSAIMFSFDRFRDNITLYGKSFDDEFISFFKYAYNKDLIVSDCHLTLSKLRWDIRRYVMVSDTNKISINDIKHSIGKQLSILSKSMCYMEGHYPRNFEDARKNADRVIHVNNFVDFYNQTQNNKDVTIDILFDIVEWMDWVVESYYNKMISEPQYIITNINQIITKTEDICCFDCSKRTEEEFKSVISEKGVSDSKGLYNLFSDNELKFKFMK